jgi:hypothetical protein
MEFAPGPELPSYLGMQNALLGIRGLVGPALGTLLVESGLLSLRQALLMIAGLTLAAAVALHAFERVRHGRLARRA